MRVHLGAFVLSKAIGCRPSFVGRVIRHHDGTRPALNIQDAAGRQWHRTRDEWQPAVGPEREGVEWLDWKKIVTACRVRVGTVAALRMPKGQVIRARWSEGESERAMAWWPLPGQRNTRPIQLYAPKEWALIKGPEEEREAA